jgi:hypothetical protein
MLSGTDRSAQVREEKKAKRSRERHQDELRRASEGLERLRRSQRDAVRVTSQPC